jgi:hypothetical protein
MNELKLFYQHCLDNGPKTPNRKVIYLDFVYKVIPQAAAYFISGVDQELELAKVARQDLSAKLEKAKKEFKETMEKETGSLNTKLTQT